MKSVFLSILLFISFKVFSQPAYTGQYNFNGDPAAAYNKYMVAQNNRTYMQIGRYKVMGTLFVWLKTYKQPICKRRDGFKYLCELQYLQPGN